MGCIELLQLEVGVLTAAISPHQEEGFIGLDNAGITLRLVIGDPEQKPVSPQEGHVLADSAVFRGSAYRQALGQRLSIVLPKMALAQARYRCARQRVAGFAARLAAIAWQAATRAPRS